MAEPLLSIRDLVTEFSTPDGTVHAVEKVSFDVFPGETLGVVGESGSGKSVTVMSVLGLLPDGVGQVTGGQADFDGHDLLTLSSAQLRRIRGRDIGIVFQDPQTSLNPVFKVGRQIAESMHAHQRISRRQARQRAIDLLASVGVPNPAERYDQYPHEYSGGMRQRAMLAMAIANNPKLLIADEPTTALDVTIQAQVMDVLTKAKDESHAATILITHDLGLIAEMADRVVVMYAGKVVETGTVDEIFHAPRHPYTLGLLSSLPRLDQRLDRLVPVSGQPPSPMKLPSGCAFHPRCTLSANRERCVTDVPAMTPAGGHGQAAACHFVDEMPDHDTAITATMGARL